MIRFQGKERKELTEATLGQVVAVPKLKHTLAGDTLCCFESTCDTSADRIPQSCSLGDRAP